MNLAELARCLDCLEVGAPSQHGRCLTCDSEALYWLAGEVRKPGPPLLTGIEREMLRDMGIEA